MPSDGALDPSLRDSLAAALLDPPVMVSIPSGYEAAFAARKQFETERIFRVGGPMAVIISALIIGARGLFRGDDVSSVDELIFERIATFVFVLVCATTAALRIPRVVRHHVWVLSMVGAAVLSSTFAAAALIHNVRLGQAAVYATMLAITICTIGFRNGFRASLLTCVAAGLLSVGVAVHFGAQPDWLLIGYAYVGASVVGLVIAWILERQEILSFYQSLLLSHEAYEGRRLNAELENMTRTDSLSGLANRRSFDDALDVEWSRMKRDRMSLALVFVDVDHFKRFNDTYGHREGDACLRAVGRALETCALRPADVAARYGGEEFVLLLPSTDLPGALACANRALLAVDALGIPHGDSPTAEHVTISIGVGVADSHSQLEARHLVDTADAALYRAKHEGRHRICSSALRGDSLRPIGNRLSEAGGHSA